MKIHPDILAAHAQFGGDLEDMQRRYETAEPAHQMRTAPMTTATDIMALHDKTMEWLQGSHAEAPRMARRLFALASPGAEALSDKQRIDEFVDAAIEAAGELIRHAELQPPPSSDDKIAMDRDRWRRVAEREQARWANDVVVTVTGLFPQNYVVRSPCDPPLPKPDFLYIEGTVYRKESAKTPEEKVKEMEDREQIDRLAKRCNDFNDQVNELRSQRDELLAALKNMVSAWFDGFDTPTTNTAGLEAMAAAREAIAKAEAVS